MLLKQLLSSGHGESHRVGGGYHTRSGRQSEGGGEAVAAHTAVTAGKAKNPKSLAKRAEVDRWDGLNIPLLERVTPASSPAATLGALDDPPATSMSKIAQWVLCQLERNRANQRAALDFRLMFPSG
jgi:hypothetical protein